MTIKEGMLVAITVDGEKLKEFCIPEKFHSSLLHKVFIAGKVFNDTESAEDYHVVLAGPLPWCIPLNALKRAVHYDNCLPFFVTEGHRASLRALDHYALGNQSVDTSEVLKWNKETGFIETRNTIYIPAFKREPTEFYKVAA